MQTGAVGHPSFVYKALSTSPCSFEFTPTEEVGGAGMAAPSLKERQLKLREAPYPFPGRGLERKWALQPCAYIALIKLKMNLK